MSLTPRFLLLSLRARLIAFAALAAFGAAMLAGLLGAGLHGETLPLTLAIAVGAGALAALGAGRLAAPVSDLARRVAAAKASGDVSRLPVRRGDEIGALARAFREQATVLVMREERSRLVLQNAIDAIVTIDAVGRIEGFNFASEKMFGYRAEEAVGQNVTLLMALEHRASHGDFLKRYAESGRSTIIGQTREISAQRKDGSRFPVEISITEIELNGKNLYTGIIRDVTERRAAESERERMLEMLAESNEELENFAYVASHDLKAPLRAIDNTASWLEEDLGDLLVGENRENMRHLRGRVKRMEKLLDDLLQYSRIGRKFDNSYVERVDGGELIRDVLELQAIPEGFQIEVSPLLGRVEVERMPLQQILHNLVGNAIKHHDRPDGVIEINVEDLGERYAFTVKDDGPGIPEEFHEQVFNMFQTLKPRDQVEGSGIGLAVVRKHVRQAGGELKLRSSEGSGATFRILWPKNSQSASKARERHANG